MTCADTLYERYPPHTGSAQILARKSLIPFWMKGIALGTLLTIKDTLYPSLYMI
jgi:hypothetical protein